MNFARPLSALTHAVDYALWPDSPALQHLHSVAWYGAAVAAAAAVLRRVEDEPGRAWLAAWVFGLSAAHAMTVGWIAARNTLIAFVVGCGILALHVAGRRVAALALTVVGFGVGEAVLGALAYVVAWQLTMARGSGVARLRALAPYAVIVAVWRLLYTRAGFGSAATAIYHDPGADPVRAVTAVLTQGPLLLAARLTQAPLDGWAILPGPAKVGLIAAGWACTLAFAWWVRPLWARDRRARFWTLGMLGALVPFALTLPMDRLVLFASLGFGGVLAAWAEHRTRSERLGIALLVLHLPLSFGFGLVRAATLQTGADMLTSDRDALPSGPEVADQTFVYVTGNFHRVHLTLLRRADGTPAPRRAVILSSMFHGVTVTRRDAHTVDVVPDGGFLQLDLDRIHRADATPLTAGTEVALPDVTITVMEVVDGRPHRARFRFAVPLEDPSLRWLQTAVTGTVGPLPVFEAQPFALPAVGETTVIAGP
jgi:hypothetical protein